MQCQSIGERPAHIPSLHGRRSSLLSALSARQSLQPPALDKQALKRKTVRSFTDCTLGNRGLLPRANPYATGSCSRSQLATTGVRGEAGLTDSGTRSSQSVFSPALSPSGDALREGLGRGLNPHPLNKTTWCAQRRKERKLQPVPPAAARSGFKNLAAGFSTSMAHVPEPSFSGMIASPSVAGVRACSVRPSASACFQNVSSREEQLRDEVPAETPQPCLAFEPLPERKVQTSSQAPQPAAQARPAAADSPDSQSLQSRGLLSRTRERPGSNDQTEEVRAPLPETIDRTRLPRHVAMILDGNSRWAERRGLPKEMGHEAGVQALKRAVRMTGTWGIQALTVFAFSTENWKRPKMEVDFLMALLERLMDDDIGELHREGVVVRVMGDLTKLPDTLQRKIEQTRVLTENNSGLKLTIAVNYSGRQDIVHACRKLAAQVASGELQAEDITDDVFEANLGTAWLGAPLASPDLLIRTSGELRISNFLLWQTAYTELVFSPCFWPDFDRTEYIECLCEFQRRDRRFGGRQVSGAALSSKQR